MRLSLNGFYELREDDEAGGNIRRHRVNFGESWLPSLKEMCIKIKLL
jgi:hypothetical protein